MKCFNYALMLLGLSFAAHAQVLTPFSVDGYVTG